MWKYIVKRILMLIPVMLATIFVVYFIMDQSDVDPAKVMLGEGATEESIQELHDELGLDDPFVVRYVRYVGKLLKGDMPVPEVNLEKSIDVSNSVIVAEEAP